MAGTLKNLYAEGNKSLTNLMTTTDSQRRGYHAVSLTNWTTTTVPAIAKGSEIEIGGALIEFQSDEPITGASDNTLYIVIDSTAFTASYTTVAPVWNDEKQGFYSGNNRILNYKIVKSGASYTKYILVDKTGLAVKSDSSILATGTLNCGAITTTGSIDLSGNALSNRTITRTSFTSGTARLTVWNALFLYLDIGEDYSATGKIGSTDHIFYYRKDTTTSGSIRGIDGAVEVIDSLSGGNISLDIEIAI